MDLKQLRIFLRVAELGSLVGAARQLDLSQPSLSRQIKQLEQDLGTPLFHRTGRGVQLTDAGRLVRERAQLLLDQAAALEQSLATRTAQVSGSLSFGLPPSLGVRVTGALVEAYRQRYPLVHLRLFEALSGDLSERLLNGGLDLAILYGSAISNSLAVEPLGWEDLHLICTRDRPEAVRGAVALAELTRLALILPDRRHGLRALLEHYAFRESLTLSVDIEVDSLRVQLDLVRRGLGYTVLPALTLDAVEQYRDLIAVPIVSPTPRRRCMLAWRRGEASGAPARAMGEMIRARFGLESEAGPRGNH
ncbi:LysR family transcriptional regulator [Alcanivorax sp. N3-2A]|nr:LysR family transcriptional regulator [Alcanivorax sp. N3-2A]|tara:strand:- start:6181 stop:7098 length:918 start_codon:yes stop_codon:yes gene_type:complete